MEILASMYININSLITRLLYIYQIAGQHYALLCSTLPSDLLKFIICTWNVSLTALLRICLVFSGSHTFFVFKYGITGENISVQNCSKHKKHGKRHVGERESQVYEVNSYSQPHCISSRKIFYLKYLNIYHFKFIRISTSCHKKLA